MKTPMVHRIPAEAGRVTLLSAQAALWQGERLSEAEAVWQTKDALSPPTNTRPLGKGTQWVPPLRDPAWTYFISPHFTSPLPSNATAAEP